MKSPRNGLVLQVIVDVERDRDMSLEVLFVSSTLMYGRKFAEFISQAVCEIDEC